MRVDGREIAVSGSLLQPLTRRTTDIFRLALAGIFLAIVITSSLITRSDWVGLERSVSRIVGVLTPFQSNLVYLAYGIAIVALPFVILIGLIAGREWKLLGAYGAAGFIAVLALSITGEGIAAPRWHFDITERLSTMLSQFLDDPRWIAMLAAVLTVSGPWLPARWRRWWWALLLAFVPIHLVVSAVVPARTLLGLAVGWFVGALVVWVVRTPALEVPLDGAVRALSRRGFEVGSLTVIRPAGQGPLELSAADQSGRTTVVEMYGPNQRSGGALRQFWRWLVLRDSETAPLQTSMHRAVEHRALMAIAVGDLGAANTTTLTLSALDRGWTMFAHTPPRGTVLLEDRRKSKLRAAQLSTGDDPAPATPATRATPAMPTETSAVPATPATPATPAAPAAGASAATGVDASATAKISSGMSVKDNTGALIGEVTAVKPDATGQDLATIRMGADVFTVETSKLALQGGAATINATQAELKSMLPNWHRVLKQLSAMMYWQR